MTGRTARRVWCPVLCDVVAICAFVVIGNRNHDEASGIGGLARTAAPFLIGLVFAWIVERVWQKPAAFQTGVKVWFITVVVGLVLRNTAFERGTALSFVIVTTVFLGACFVGWRLVATRLRCACAT